MRKYRKIWLISKLKDNNIGNENLYVKILNAKPNQIKKYINDYRNLKLDKPIKSIEFLIQSETLFLSENFLSTKKSLLTNHIDYILKKTSELHKNTKDFDRFIQTTLQIIHKNITKFDRKINQLKTTKRIKFYEKNKKHFEKLSKWLYKTYFSHTTVKENKTKKKLNPKINYKLRLISELMDHLKFIEFRTEIKNDKTVRKRNFYDDKSTLVKHIEKLRNKDPNMIRIDFQKCFGKFVNSEPQVKDQISQIRKLVKENKKLSKSNFSDRNHIKNKIVQNNEKINELKKTIKFLKNISQIKKWIKDLDFKNGKFNKKPIYNKITKILKTHKKQLIRNKFGNVKETETADETKKWERTDGYMVSRGLTEREYNFDTLNYMILNVHKRSRKLKELSKETNNPSNLSNWINYIENNPNLIFLGSQKNYVEYNRNRNINNLGSPKFSIFYQSKISESTQDKINSLKYKLYTHLVNEKNDDTEKLSLNPHKTNFENWIEKFKSQNKKNDNKVNWIKINFEIPYRNDESKYDKTIRLNNFKDFVSKVNPRFYYKYKKTLPYSMIYLMDSNKPKFHRLSFGNPASKEGMPREYGLRKMIRKLGNRRSVIETKSKLKPLIDLLNSEGNVVKKMDRYTQSDETKLVYDTLIRLIYKKPKETKLTLTYYLKEFKIPKIQKELRKYTKFGLDKYRETINALQTWLNDTELHGNTNIVQNKKNELKSLRNTLMDKIKEQNKLTETLFTYYYTIELMKEKFNIHRTKNLKVVFQILKNEILKDLKQYRTEKSLRLCSTLRTKYEMVLYMFNAIDDIITKGKDISEKQKLNGFLNYELNLENLMDNTDKDGNVNVRSQFDDLLEMKFVGEKNELKNGINFVNCKSINYVRLLKLLTKTAKYLGKNDIIDLIFEQLKELDLMYYEKIYF